LKYYKNIYNNIGHINIKYNPETERKPVTEEFKT
jgi:hypothetical protein